MKLWKTYPIGAAASERMEMRGLKASFSHAVLFPSMMQPRALCGVKTFSLCMDSSLATDELPDCPRCQSKIAQIEHPKSFTLAQFVAWGKQGGLKSTRKLTTEESKRMLAIREANRKRKRDSFGPETVMGDGPISNMVSRT